MTDAARHESRPRPLVPAAPPWSAWHAAGRLARLHLASRRIPSALVLLAGCGGTLAVALQWHWTLGSGTGAQALPVVIEAGAAAIITVTTRSPFGESESIFARWLPLLRLACTMLLLVAAVGALAAAAAIGGGLDGGNLDLLRNTAGFTGLGLLLATLTGGSLAWTGPVAYMIIAEYAIVQLWTTPLVWPARPSHDNGATIWAAVAFTTGVIAITTRGARYSVNE